MKVKVNALINDVRSISMHSTISSPISTEVQWLSGRVLDSRSRGDRFEPHCIVFVSKTLYHLLSAGSTQEYQSRLD